MMRIVFWYLFGVQNITILNRWNQYSNLAIKYKYLNWNSHIKLAWYLLLNVLVKSLLSLLSADYLIQMFP